ncbi:MAG: MgtC/SapB family protein [Clostridia bacterium]|nr:MgtC/SapB family protein [Clostridia bacterium]
MEVIITQLSYFLRVIVAGICGLILGYERKNRAKEAGLRTHCIVACAAALMMIVSKYGFFDLIRAGMYEGIEVKLDPSRVASTIISSIGFLGAGMIFVQKQTIKGLTTAAGIWATTGIGMAIGAGMYTMGILVTALILFAQIILHGNSRFLAVPHLKVLHIYNVDKTGYQKEITELLKEKNVAVEDIEISHNVEKQSYNYDITLELPSVFDEEELISVIEFDSSIESLK